MRRILIIDDEQASSRTLKLHFNNCGFDVETAGDAEEGLAYIKTEQFDLVISDIRMPGRDGLSLLNEVHELMPELPVIMITAFQDLDSTVAAMRGGAIDYVPKPIDIEELEAAIDRVFVNDTNQSGDDFILSSDNKTDLVVGRSSGMQDVFKLIGTASQNRVNVLIYGELGTMKEATARAIHNAGPYADEQFVAVNCSSFLNALQESELYDQKNEDSFGPEDERTSKLNSVGEGTLFLDKVNELSSNHQNKLLRLLEENKYSPVDVPRLMGATCRFILSSDIDLSEDVAKGHFRKDLYYRLSALSIYIPPLRERKEDIPFLIERLINKINKDAGKAIKRVSSDCMDILVAYDWSGDVRHLENVLMKVIVIASGDTLNTLLLPDEIVNGKKSSAPAIQQSSGKTLKELERQHIHAVLTATGWHKGKACGILGISRPRLDRRIDEFRFVREK